MKLLVPSNCFAQTRARIQDSEFQGIKKGFFPTIFLKYLRISGISGLFLNRLDVLMKGLLFWLSFLLSVNCFLGNDFCDALPFSLMSVSVAHFLKVFIDGLRLRFKGGFPCGGWSFLFRALDCFNVNKPDSKNSLMTEN